MANTWLSGGRRYYKYKKDALRARRRGDRIYYDAYEGGYYIVRPQKSSFWGW